MILLVIIVVEKEKITKWCINMSGFIQGTFQMERGFYFDFNLDT